MAAAQQGKEQADRLINSLQEISFVEIGAVIIGVWLAIFVIRKTLPFLAERGPGQVRLYLLGAVPILRLLLTVFAIVWIFPIVFNLTFQNFLVIAGAASVAIGFAFKDYASSLIAGIVVLIERPYRPGDWIKIKDDYGEVTSVGMRAVQLLTPAANVITVPHDRIWTSNISNSNDGAQTLMCVADFYISPDHDSARIQAVLQDVGLTSAFLHYGQPVFVVLSEKPGTTHYKLKAYPFDMRDQFRLISDLTVRGKQAIYQAGARETTFGAILGQRASAHEQEAS